MATVSASASASGSAPAGRVVEKTVVWSEFAEPLIDVPLAPPSPPVLALPPPPALVMPPVPAPVLPPVPAVPMVTTTAEPGTAAAAAIAFAMAQRGLPYVWGGDGPQSGEAGFDCSGLTTAAYDYADVDLPRTAHTQFYAGPHVPAGAQLEPGDLVFYGVPERVHHVGLYLGEGRMVNAPTFGKPVRLAWVRYPGDDYLGATRPAAGKDAPGLLPAPDVPRSPQLLPSPEPVPEAQPAPTEFPAPAAPDIPTPVPTPEADVPAQPDESTEDESTEDENAEDENADDENSENENSAEESSEEEGPADEGSDNEGSDNESSEAASPTSDEATSTSPQPSASDIASATPTPEAPTTTEPEPVPDSTSEPTTTPPSTTTEAPTTTEDDERPPLTADGDRLLLPDGRELRLTATETGMIALPDDPTLTVDLVPGAELHLAGDDDRTFTVRSRRTMDPADAADLAAESPHRLVLLQPTPDGDMLVVVLAD